LYFNVASIARSIPSGFVPGDLVGGHDLKFGCKLGGEEGRDCILSFLLRVLFRNLGDYAVISFISELLYVFCTPTADS
jgi:hypothetical protein